MIIRVIDLETTGTEPPQAEVCEVGLCDLHLNERRIDAPMSWLCGVTAMPPEARAVHHISGSECQGLAPFDPAALWRTPCHAAAAHNAEFEAGFVVPPVPMICTYKVALRVWPDAPAHNNGTLRYWLEDAGLTQPAHRAGPDAHTTAHVLLALFDAGATFDQMVAWSQEPRVMPVCPIGKFRGKPWAEVERGFLDWMLRQADMEADLKWNARRETDRRDAAQREARLARAG